MKGGFGGGFAIVGIPLLALVMDPLAVGARGAPLFVVMDLFALRYWKPTTWSKPDLSVLLPGLVIGIGLGTVLLNVLDGRAVAIAIALLTLIFSGLWFKGGGEVVVRPRSVPKALAAGVGSGVTTMVAHSGGPPLALYLLGLGLPKALYAGTTSIFFTMGNLIKMTPWLLVAGTSSELFWLMVISLPASGPLFTRPRPSKSALRRNNQHILYDGESHQDDPLAFGGRHEFISMRIKGLCLFIHQEHG